MSKTRYLYMFQVAKGMSGRFTGREYIDTTEWEILESSSMLEDVIRHRNRLLRNNQVTRQGSRIRRYAVS